MIAFFGPDGSGKTTQVSLLINELRSKGLKARKVWIRSPHTFAYLFSRLLIKIGYCRTVVNPYGFPQKILLLPIGKYFRFLWYFVEFLSVKPLIILKVRIPILLGYTVVAERFIVDTIVSVAYYGNDVHFIQSSFAQFFLRLSPKNTCFIHLDSDYSTIMGRRGCEVDSSDFIDFQRLAYGLVRNSMNAKSLSTSSLNVAQTLGEIKKIIGLS